MITENQLEQLAIQWFQDTAWNYVHGAVIVPEGVAAAVRRLNPKLPESVVEEVVYVVTKPSMQSNRAFHRYLMDGVLVELTNAQGEEGGGSRAVGRFHLGEPQ